MEAPDLLTVIQNTASSVVKVVGPWRMQGQTVHLADKVCVTQQKARLMSLPC